MIQFQLVHQRVICYLRQSLIRMYHFSTQGFAEQKSLMWDRIYPAFKRGNSWTWLHLCITIFSNQMKLNVFFNSLMLLWKSIIFNEIYLNWDVGQCQKDSDQILQSTAKALVHHFWMTMLSWTWKILALEQVEY